MSIKSCLVALLLSLPLSAQAALAIQHWQTPQGARVFFVESHELPMLDVAVDFSAGSARDPTGKAGLARLAHGLLDQGAGGLSDTDIAHRLADVGAVLSGRFDRDRAGVTLRTLSSAAEKDKALELLALPGGEALCYFFKVQGTAPEVGADRSEHFIDMVLHAACHVAVA